MIQQLKNLSPFIQLVALISIGFVSYFLLSALIITIVQNAVPGLSLNNVDTLVAEHGVLFMLIFYVPMQFGLFFIPGMLYMLIREKSKLGTDNSHRNSWVLWGGLVFVGLIFLLPFMTEINTQIIQFLGFHDTLMLDYNLAEERLLRLFGPDTGNTNFIAAIVIVAIITGICEEFAFRRFLFQHILDTTQKVWISIFASSFFFAILHFNYLQFIPLITFGLALAIIYYTTRSIWPGIFLHAANNALNVFWIHTDSFPNFMVQHDWKITIPTLLLMSGLVLWKRKKLIFQ